MNSTGKENIRALHNKEFVPLAVHVFCASWEWGGRQKKVKWEQVKKRKKGLWEWTFR